MAATATIDSDGRGVAGDMYVRRGSITLGTYAAGGIAVTKATFQLAVKLHDLRVDPSGGYVPRWDKTNAKIMVYLQKDPAAAGGADIPLPELGAVDISATAFRFVATGK